MDYSYYDYNVQNWCNDAKGFESFHVSELDFLTTSQSGKGPKEAVKHHIDMLTSAGLTDNISEGFYNFIK
jgi:hypothetical protein